MKSISGKNIVRVVIALLLLCFVIVITISAKSCSNRKNAKSGSSSYNTFTINAPSNLTATAVSYSQINLSWQDNSNNEDGFEIERRTPSTDYSLLMTLGQNAGFFSDISQFLLFNTYYYRIRAYNIIGDRSYYSNDAVVIISPPVWSALAAGESYTIALTGNGNIWAWGNNTLYQLGLGENASFTITVPTLLGSDSDWSQIATGYYHTLSIKTNRTLWAWGSNDSGQLGLGTSGYNDPYRAEPTPIGNDSDWLVVAGGANHTLGIKTTGTLWSWGYNASGQLGLGYYGDVFNPDDPLNYVVTPTQIGTDSDWACTIAGSAFSFALKTNKTLWSWGWNDSGQLGGGGNNKPGKIGTASDWSAVAGGYAHTIALKTDATLWAWGESYTSTPTKIITDTDWSKITAGGATPSSGYSFALKTTGLLWVWGQNGSGQLGLGDYAIRETPTQIGIRTDWNNIIAGGYHAVGITNDGELWLWGRNNYGQLGLGNTVNQNMPINLNRPQPGNLIATIVSPSRIDVSWIDNSFNETGFKLERSLDGITYTQISVLPAGTTSYSDTDINSMNAYYYRAKTSYGSIDSVNSNVAEALNIRWSQQLDAGAPLRSGHSAVWDDVGKKMIMFGGADDVDYTNDLWWYEPVSNTWTQKIASGAPDSPSPRSAPMVWDQAGERAIMFGGDIGGGGNNEMWWYYPVSNTWIQKYTSSTPSARYVHSIVWDGEKMIMFGGYGSGYRNDLWWYEPISNTWTEKIVQDAPGSPSSRWAHSAVWDPEGERMLIFGGYALSGFTNELWAYYPLSNTWTAITPVGTAPVARMQAAMVWDGQKVVMFGGAPEFVGLQNDLWWYEPVLNAWIEKKPGGPPLPRSGHSMVWDLIGQRIILFGGADDLSLPLNDLWWLW